MKKFILMQDMVGQMQEQLERMDCMKNLVLKIQQYLISYLNSTYSDFTIKTTRTTDTFYRYLSALLKLIRGGRCIYVYSRKCRWRNRIRRLCL